MELLVADYETAFGDDYTLSRMTTEAYIRDPRFKAHGCGFRLPTGEYRWITGAALPAFFASIDWTKTAILAQHAQFEALIFSHHYGVKPAFWFDTRCMGNLLLPHIKKSLDSMAQHFKLPGKTVPYNLFRGVRDLPPHIERQVADGCLHDVFLNYSIFMQLLPAFPRGELEVADLTIRMFSEPTLQVDVPRAERLAAAIAARKETTLEDLGVDREVLASRECFADLLRELGVDPPTKTSATTGETTYSFAKNDPGMKALLESEDEAIATLAAAKLGVSSTIGETRARRMADIGRRGAATLYINYAAAHTGRPGGGDKFNPLNMPRDGELRSCLQAPKGHMIVVADENAIECRLVNYLAGQQNVVSAFARHEDVYANLATDIYKHPVNKKDHPKERFVGKTVELGSGYGLGWKTLKYKMNTGSMGGTAMKLSDDDAQLFTNTYRGTHRQVVNYWQHAAGMLMVLMMKQTMDWGPVRIKGGFIILPNGTPLDFTTLHQRVSPEGKQEFWVTRKTGASRMHGPKLVENITQALAWTITTDAMRVLCHEMKIVLAPYDEIVAVVPEHEADAALKRMIEVMSRVPHWAPGLPVEAEGHIDDRYSK